MLELIFHLLVYIRWSNLYPLEKAWERVGRSPEQLANFKSGQRKAVPTYEEYIEKIAKPRLDAYIKSLNPAFVSGADLTAEQIIRKFRDKVFSKETYENYIKDISPEKRERIMDKIPLNAAKYATKMTFGDWRLEGPLSPDGTSALKIILGWLCGDKKIVNALRTQDKLIQGAPVQVILPERVGEFKLKFRTLLKRMLDIIQCAHYDPKVVHEQNDRLKQFMDSYADSEFVVSIKWVINYETAQTWHSPEVLKIRGEIYEKLLSPESFQKIAGIFEPPAENLKALPDKLLMDMYLDICVRLQ